MLSATVTTPVPLLIANMPASLPAVIDQPAPFAASPVDAIVKTSSSSAAFSAKLAELAVIEIAVSVIVIVSSSTYVLSAPSLTSMNTLSDVDVS